MGKHSDQTKTGHNIIFPSKWWKNSWLWIIAVALLSVATIVLLFGFLSENTVLSVGKYKYTAERYDALYEQAKLFGTDENFVDDLILIATDISSLEEVGVKVTEEEIKVADNFLFSNTITGVGSEYDNNLWRQLLALHKALSDKYDKSVRGDLKGAVFVFSFSRYKYTEAEARLTLEDENQDVDFSLYGDPGSIELDRQYAESKAKEYRDMAIEDSGEENLDRLVKETLSDIRVSDFVGTRLFGYTNQINWQDEIANSVIAQAMAKTTKPAVSEINIYSADVGQNPDNYRNEEVAYWFYVIENVVSAPDSDLESKYVDRKSSIMRNIVNKISKDN